MDVPQAEIFIKQNWLKLTDFEISTRISQSLDKTMRIRRSMGLDRTKMPMSYQDRRKIAKLLKMFFNGNNIRVSAEHAQIEYVTACNMIKRYAFFKERSYNTITLVIESKINFKEEQ